MRILNYNNLIKKSLFSVLIGLIVYLVLYYLFNLPTDPPLASLIVSAISGLIGVLISIWWIFRIRRLYAVLIILAYISRIIVGVVLYVGIMDNDYFQGNGVYKNKNYEFSHNYFNAVKASKLIKQNHTILPSKVIPDYNVYKDRNIQTWMGIYLAIGNSKNAMDFAAFNSFHHIIAGIFIILLGFVFKLDVSNSIRAGTLVTWIPWAFPSSLLWRDSIGFAFVCIAIFLIFYSSNMKWKIWQILFYVFSFFLASSVRTAYGLLILILIPVSLYYKYYRLEKINWKVALFFFIIFVVISSLMPYLESLFFFRYEETLVYKDPLKRIISFPLLVLRGLAGPFPWQYNYENSFVFFDYFYHVFQFSVMLLFLKYSKISSKIVNPVFLTFFLFWFLGTMAIGVHTAYLAVSLPFLILITPLRMIELSKYFIVILFIFIIVSLLYSISGFYGRGLIIKSTGY